MGQPLLVSRPLLLLLLLAFAGFSTEALAQKPTPSDKFLRSKIIWTESLIDDNVTSLNASPGSYEFSFQPGFSNLHGDWASEMGWEIATTLTPRLGLSTSFASSGFRQSADGRIQPQQTGMELGVQYLFARNYTNIWVSSLNVRPPTWYRQTPELERGWVFEPSLLFGKQLFKDLSARARFSPGFEWVSDVLEPFGSLHIAAIWQGKHLGFGNEMGIYSGRNKQQRYFAPQLHLRLSKLSLCLGYQFTEEVKGRWDNTSQRVLLRMTYFWSRNWY